MVSCDSCQSTNMDNRFHWLQESKRFIRHMRPRRTQYGDACEFRSSPCDYMVGNTSNDSDDVADQVLPIENKFYIIIPNGVIESSFSARNQAAAQDHAVLVSLEDFLAVMNLVFDDPSFCGLSEQVKDEHAKVDLPADLEDNIRLCIRIDQRQAEKADYRELIQITVKNRHCLPLERFMLHYNSLKYNSLKYNSLKYNSLKYNSLKYNSLKYNSLKYNSLKYNSLKYNSYSATFSTLLLIVPHDSEDNEILNTSIIDTSLQMWLQNNWTAKVSERLEEEEYEISVYDEPGTILWNTKRCLKDFKLIYERICQNWPDFIMFTKPNTRGPMSDDDSQFFFTIDTTPDEFIHKLLNLIEVKHEKEVVFFFSPFEYEDDDVRELVNCLPDSDIADSDIEPFSEQYNTDDEFNGDSSNSEIDPVEIGFKTYTKQDEKKEGKKSSSNDLQDTSGAAINKSKKDDESNIYSGDKENDSKDCYQHDGSKIKNLLRSRKKNKSSSRSKLPDMPSTSITRDKEFFSIHQPPPPITMDSTSSNSQKLSEKGLDVIGQNITQTREVKKDMEQQKQKLQETLLDALYHLIDEVIAGGKSRTSFLHRHG
ncbi:uncharacterized protein LOC142659991 [Rhinoderma darwinii]|uniref:uncharacterized protein LOC142659991 n=1 Tax=Rhinoderma darwinii TaxID=43563 RepID=UPI003F6641B9